ncbi:MAG TPA: 5-nitroimidazole antibiotic resistance protein [Lachnospiraceae bacterium]|nr:5-nitroimidazole antibiotic resistance protein [Lachnospiraceae bacterium]
MFRKMRRGKQALSQEEIRNLLTQETRGVLSVQGDDGYPYGFPINFYYSQEDNRLYFHGADFGYHIDALRRDPKVSFCVYGQDVQHPGEWLHYVKSVIIFGKAVLIDDPKQMEDIARKLCSKFPCPVGYADQEIAKDLHRTLCIAVDIENINGKLVQES